MLKRSSIKKICLAAFCLLILLILYLFPKNKPEKESLSPSTTYTITSISDVIYLLDSNDYVSRVNISLSKDEITDKALELISYLTEGTTDSELIPNGFRPILPKNTKVLGCDLSDGNLKINFSKELLNISEKKEVHMVEALVYTLTSLEGVDNITILVDGTILSELPHSKEMLPNPIDRSYGINKKYDIDSIKGTTKTTMYYLAKNEELLLLCACDKSLK